MQSRAHLYDDLPLQERVVVLDVERVLWGEGQAVDRSRQRQAYLRGTLHAYMPLRAAQYHVLGVDNESNMADIQFLSHAWIFNYYM